MSYFSHNLKFWRTQKGLSQEKFATELGINRGKLATYEEAVEPRQEFLLDLVDKFYVNLHYLLTRKMTEGTFDTFFLEEPAQDLPPEQKKRSTDVIRKVLALTDEDDPEERRKITSELIIDITQMIEENNEMKGELLMFMKRMKGAK